MSEIASYKDLLTSNIPNSVQRVVKLVGKGINKYSMIKDKDEIILGVSGGKDSLVLALSLAIRRRWLPIDYKIRPVLINWTDFPIEEENQQKLREFFDLLGFGLTIIDEPQRNPGFCGDFNCYLCSRNRRRILFDYAREQNIQKIALGHHLDDIIETSFMNLCFRGNFSTMLPVQNFFNGAIKVIRPMNLVPEAKIITLCSRYDIPVVKPVCPLDHENIRSQLKPIIRDLARMDKHLKEHIYNAHNLEEAVKNQIEITKMDT